MFQLMNVIVDNSDAAGKILSNGRLARRTVMLPLDKMNSSAIPLKVLQIAQKSYGSKNVFRAIDLVEFDNRLEPAMNHIFGNVLVCSNLEVANKVRPFFFYFKGAKGSFQITQKQDFVGKFFSIESPN